MPLMLLAIFKLSAQSDFREGYLITNSGDTITGLINYKGNKSNAKKCLFKADDNSEIQLFTPFDINAYRFVDSKYYVSKQIKTDEITEQLFLEYLINGIVDVYYYRDEKGEHYLLENSESKLYFLNDEQEEIVIDHTRYVNQSKEYIGILKAILSESSPATFQKVDKMNLNHKSLIQIAEDYHNDVCTGEECIIYAKKLPTIKINYGVIAAIRYNSISKTVFFLDKYSYLDQIDLKISPSFGCYYKVNLPYLNERLYFQHEISFSKMKLNASSNIVEQSDYSVSSINVELNQGNLCNNLLIKYYYPRWTIKPFVQTGIFVNYFLGVDYKKTVNKTFSWGEHVDSYESKENIFSKYGAGINLGIGIQTILFKRESVIDFNYQRGFILLEGLNTNEFSLNLAFQVGK